MDEPLIKSPAEFTAIRERAPEFLGDLMDHVTEVLKEGGVPEHRAEMFGLATALRLRGRWAKQLIYFAEGRAIDLRSRNHRIWDEFNGHNHVELAAKYGVSTVWLYRIIELMRNEQKGLNQGNLDLR